MCVYLLVVEIGTILYYAKKYVVNCMTLTIIITHQFKLVTAMCLQFPACISHTGLIFRRSVSYNKYETSHHPFPELTSKTSSCLL